MNARCRRGAPGRKDGPQVKHRKAPFQQTDSARSQMRPFTGTTDYRELNANFISQMFGIAERR
jgi:hypothetical protein